MMYVNIVSISAVCVAVAFSGWEGEHPQAKTNLQAIPQKHRDRPVPTRYPSLYVPAIPWSSLVDAFITGYGKLKGSVPTLPSSIPTLSLSIPTLQLSIPTLPVLHYGLLDVREELKVWMKHGKMILDYPEGFDKSLVVLLTHGSFLIYYIFKLYAVEVERTGGEMSARSNGDPGTQNHEEVRHIYPKMKSLCNRNKQLEFDLDHKVRELEVMGRTVYQLQRQSQLQERDITQKAKEVEEMARTIEYLQRPSSKKWSDILDKVYMINCSTPQLISSEYVYLPMVTELELNQRESRGSDGESDSEAGVETEGEHELEWDEWR